MACVLTEEDARDVLLRERMLLEPALRAAPDRVIALLHPDYLEHGASGRVWDRPTVIAALSADPAIGGVATDFSAVALADDVVLLTYQISGSPASLRSSVWLRDEEAGWLIRFHQGTRLPAP